MNEYQQQVIDLYKNPKNFGKPIKYDYSKKVVNLSCGDEVEVFITLSEDKKTIIDVKFVGEGCSISIASASLLTEAIKGMTLDEFEKFTFDNLLEILGIDLTMSRQKCAMISFQAAKDSLKS